VIDAEAEIFKIVAEKVRAVYPNIYMTGEYVRAPAKFPAVSLEEKNNSIWRNLRTVAEVENAAAVMYEMNVYSNLKTGKKKQAKEIAAVVDEALTSMGFTRTMLNPMPNASDATIYRITGRYQAIIIKDERTNRFVIHIR